MAPALLENLDLEVWASILLTNSLVIRQVAMHLVDNCFTTVFGPTEFDSGVASAKNTPLCFSLALHFAAGSTTASKLYGAGAGTFSTLCAAIVTAPGLQL